jgi:two-component system sensor histidine kinase KdpD
MGGYGVAVAAVGVATAVSFILSAFFEPTNLAMIYLLGALAVAVRGRRGPVIAASILSVLCFDFFFIPPRLPCGWRTPNRCGRSAYCSQR